MPETTPEPQQRPDALPRLTLRPAEAALALGISERKLWEITADKTSGIPFFKLGPKCVLYPVAALEKWIAERVGKGARP